MGRDSRARTGEKGGSARDSRGWQGAIEAEEGFRRILSPSEIRAGDLLACRYAVGGHSMIAAGCPIEIGAREPVVTGTTQWALEVIDSASDGHGPHDQRSAPGAGRGMIRLYAKGGVIHGYSWSVLAGSTLHTAPERSLRVGRVR